MQALPGTWKGSKQQSQDQAPTGSRARYKPDSGRARAVHDSNWHKK
jgi:hypothetical protein